MEPPSSLLGSSSPGVAADQSPCKQPPSPLPLGVCNGPRSLAPDRSLDVGISYCGTLPKLNNQYLKTEKQDPQLLGWFCFPSEEPNCAGHWGSNCENICYDV